MLRKPMNHPALIRDLKLATQYHLTKKLINRPALIRDSNLATKYNVTKTYEPPCPDT